MSLSKVTSLPIDRDLAQIIKVTAYEQAKLRNKPISYTMMANEIVKKGLQVMEDEKTKSIVIVDGKVWNPEQKMSFELRKKDEVKPSE